MIEGRGGGQERGIALDLPHASADSNRRQSSIMTKWFISIDTTSSVYIEPGHLGVRHGGVYGFSEADPFRTQHFSEPSMIVSYRVVCFKLWLWIYGLLRFPPSPFPL